MKKRGITIQNYLVTGDPDGVTLSYVSQWTGQAIKIPRNLFAENKKMIEINRPGIYFLIGKDMNNPDKKLVYVGEANNISERISSHLRDDKKDFFDVIVAFSSKDENLNVAHTKFLEKRVIELLSRNLEYQSTNGKQGNSIKIAKMVEDEMETFLDYLKVVLPTIGYSFLDYHSRVLRDKKRTKKFYISKGNIQATANLTSNGVLVLKSSGFRMVDNDSLSGSYKNLRATLLEKGIVKRLDSNYGSFTQDYEFSSPSQAAAILLGYSVNGRTEWKDESDRSIKKIEELELE